LLVKPGLGVTEDLLADGDDLNTGAVDRLAYQLLEFFLAWHRPLRV
jgi:hypothetical protein